MGYARGQRPMSLTSEISLMIDADRYESLSSRLTVNHSAPLVIVAIKISVREMVMKLNFRKHECSVRAGGADACLKDCGRSASAQRKCSRADSAPSAKSLFSRFTNWSFFPDVSLSSMVIFYLDILIQSRGKNSSFVKRMLFVALTLYQLIQFQWTFRLLLVFKLQKGSAQ